MFARVVVCGLTMALIVLQMVSLEACTVVTSLNVDTVVDTAWLIFFAFVFVCVWLGVWGVRCELCCVRGQFLHLIMDMQF